MPTEQEDRADELIASGAACAILGLLAFRAGLGFAARPVKLTTPAQLDAWQQGWAAGYDASKIKDPMKAYSVASYNHLKSV